MPIKLYFYAALRKSPAILFLALLSFNLSGYRLWLSYAFARSDKRMETILEHQAYDSSELITIRMPFSMPYANTGDEFERVAGEIELDGKIYKFVKRRIYEGELILLCLPDKQKTQLRLAGAEFYKGVNDLSGFPGSPKRQNAVFKLFQSVYDDQTSEWLSPKYNRMLQYPLAANQARWPSPVYAIPGQPPELSLAPSPLFTF